MLDVAACRPKLLFSRLGEAHFIRLTGHSLNFDGVRSILRCTRRRGGAIIPVSDDVVAM